MFTLQKLQISMLKYCFKNRRANQRCKYLQLINLCSRNLNSLVPTNLKANKLQIRKLVINDLPDVIEIFRQNFSKSEPLVRGLQFPDRIYSPALEEFWKFSIFQGMSYLAAANNIKSAKNSLGVIVNTKILPWEPDDWWKFATCVKCSKTRNLITLYGFLINDSKIHKRYQTNQIFNVAHVVENDMKCKEYDETPINVKLALIENSFNIGKLLGYNYGTLMGACSKLSIIANRLEMDLAYEYPCDRLVNENLEPILCKIEPNSHIRVYIKDLIKNDTPTIQT